MRLWNVHNFGLTAEEEEWVTRELTASAGCCSLVAGDFNFLSDGDKVLRLAEAGGARLDGGDGSGAARQKSSWRTALKEYTEFDTDSFSHYSKAHALLNKIDKIFTSLPAWAVINLEVEAMVEGCPVESLHHGGSDHVFMVRT